MHLYPACFKWLTLTFTFDSGLFNVRIRYKHLFLYSLLAAWSLYYFVFLLWVVKSTSMNFITVFTEQHNLTRTVWFIRSTLRAPFTLRNPHLQTCLTSRSLQPVTRVCRLLWHSITSPVPAIAKVPNWGVIGHSSLPPIGRFGPVKRAGCAVWNEMVSTFDSSHVDGTTGPLFLIPSSLAVTQQVLCRCRVKAPHIN